jgi:hypothetical protein
VQIELPSSELEPSEQSWHVDDSEAPTTAENLPAAHAMHAAAPADSLYLPASHAMQLPPSGPEYPALQVQFELPIGDQEPGEQLWHVDVPFSVEYVPAAHALHAAAPVDALNHPATHGVHAPPLGPEEPALQMQLVKAELPTLPSDVLEFAGQAMHCSDPVNSLYDPASHTVHACPSGPE